MVEFFKGRGGAAVLLLCSVVAMWGLFLLLPRTTDAEMKAGVLATIGTILLGAQALAKGLFSKTQVVAETATKTTTVLKEEEK